MSTKIRRITKVACMGVLVLFIVTISLEMTFAATTIKFAHYENPLPYENPCHGMAAVFKGVLERETRGEIKVNIFPAAQLGKEREIMESLKMGSIQSIVLSEGTSVLFFPPMEVLGIPFLNPSIEVAWKVMDGPFGQEFKEAMRKQTGIRMVSVAAPGGFRNFGTNKVVHRVEDLKGLKIRTMAHPIHQEIVRSLGATPTPVAYTEVYTAIKTGVVDGLELPYQAILNMKLEEVIKYYIVDGHVFNQQFVYVNDKWFTSLPADHQKAVLKAGKAAEIAGRGIVYISDSVGADQLREKGVEIYFPTKEEREEFKKLAQPAVLSLLGKRVEKKWIDGILKAVEEASAAE